MHDVSTIEACKRGLFKSTVEGVMTCGGELYSLYCVGVTVIVVTVEWGGAWHRIYAPIQNN